MPGSGRGTGGLVDDEVRVENVALDEGVPALLWEDAHGVRIALDLTQDAEAITRALTALLAERFATGDWKRSLGET
jgi:hypothetical protein